MVALSSICHLRTLLEVVSEAESPAMVIHTHAILVLEGLRHHVGSDPFALPFDFLGIIGLPFVPLLVLPFIILSPLFGLPFILGNLNRFRQRDQMKSNLRAMKSCWYCCIKGTLSCGVTPDWNIVLNDLCPHCPVCPQELLDGRLDIPLRRILTEVSKELGDVAFMHCPFQQICERIGYSSPTQGLVNLHLRGCHLIRGVGLLLDYEVVCVQLDLFGRLPHAWPPPTHVKCNDLVTGRLAVAPQIVATPDPASYGWAPIASRCIHLAKLLVEWSSLHFFPLEAACEYGPTRDWPQPPSADSAPLCALQNGAFSTLLHQLTTSERPASSGRRYGMQRHQSVFLVDHEQKQVYQGSIGHCERVTAGRHSLDPPQLPSWQGEPRCPQWTSSWATVWQKQTDVSLVDQLRSSQDKDMTKEWINDSSKMQKCVPLGHNENNQLRSTCQLWHQQLCWQRTGVCFYFACNRHVSRLFWPFISQVMTGCLRPAKQILHL